MSSRPVRPVAAYAADGIEDVINTLPVLFGFRPAESVVAIATYGRRHRFGFRMRFDIPAASGIDLAARTVEHHLRTQAADGAVIVVLTERQGLARDLNEAITAMLGPIQPVIIARANAHSYWVDVPGFPKEGLDYEVSDHHIAVVAAVAAVQQILPDRAAVERLYAPADGDRRDEMTRACADAASRLAKTAIGTLPGAKEHLDALIRHVASCEPLDDTQVAELCVWLADPQVCRYLWESISTESVAAWRDGLTYASQRVVPPYEPAVLALAAFAAWASGDGARALIAAGRAHQADPHHELVVLIKAIVEEGLPPKFWHRTRSQS